MVPWLCIYSRCGLSADAVEGRSLLEALAVLVSQCTSCCKCTSLVVRLESD